MGFTGVQDLDYIILGYVDDITLFRICGLNSYFKSLCDYNFWNKRAQQHDMWFPEKQNSNKGWKAWYVVLVWRPPPPCGICNKYSSYMWKDVMGYNSEKCTKCLAHGGWSVNRYDNEWVIHPDSYKPYDNDKDYTDELIRVSQDTPLSMRLRIFKETQKYYPEQENDIMWKFLSMIKYVEQNKN